LYPAMGSRHINKACQ